jgi:hypothetical protein
MRIKRMERTGLSLACHSRAPVRRPFMRTTFGRIDTAMRALSR